MIGKLIVKLLVGIVGTGLAAYLIPEITTNGEILTIIYVGAIIGLLLFFIKPLLQLITFPLRAITLNLFTIVIIMGLIWIVDVLAPAQTFEIEGIFPLFLYSLIIWGLEIITSFVKK